MAIIHPAMWGDADARVAGRVDGAGMIISFLYASWLSLPSEPVSLRHRRCYLLFSSPLLPPPLPYKAYL
jgi:hypothetical protein